MKLKNNTVKNNILTSARDEFFVNGYKDASIREIAKRANITPGNIYRYFPSKEDLFEAVVGDTNKNIMKIISLEELPLPKIITDSKMVTEFIVSKAIDLVLKNKYEVVILLTKANESKYETTLNDVIEYTAKTIDESSKKPNYDLSRIISKALVDAVISIIQENINNENKIKMLILDFVNILFSNKSYSEDIK